MAERQILPFPTTFKDRLKAQIDHQTARDKNLPIPHFIKDDGTLHYWDNKGGGKLGLNNLGIKLSNEAKRLAKKKGATPTLEMFTEAYGEKLGKQLFNREKLKLKQIYTTTPSSTHDIDHINSMASGGVHHSSNLRMQNNSRNRSEGARGLTPYQRTSLMLTSTPQDQIRIQGPQVTPRRRQQILQGATPRQHYSNNLRPIRPVNTTLGSDSHPLGGSVIDTDPLFGQGPRMRIP